MKPKETINLYRVISLLVIALVTFGVMGGLGAKSHLYPDEWLSMFFLTLIFLLVCIFELEYERKQKGISANTQTTFIRLSVTYTVSGGLIYAISYLPEFYRPVMIPVILLTAVSNSMVAVSFGLFFDLVLAPTEVLAQQHYETFQKLCEQFGLHFPVILLTGSMTAKQKRSAYERLELYENALIVGTHALIQEKPTYANLALVITDEQHRFGVRQREEFAQKGDMPHILVMSATPIPRTLAIIIYGDMDISVVDEVPARRLPIKNCVVNTAYRPKAYAFVADEVKKGHQAYVICPLVEASEETQGENVIDYSKTLMEELPSGIQVGVLHGKMKSSKKNEIMQEFAENKIQVLVSTTVVEVGVNVPNATVMLIENADRFGLAQLHQLRGRVGRGDAQSYCIMINASSAKTAKKRLEILNKSNDGFFIASEDLKLRGPGDFFGIRQSGDLVFALADIYQDAAVLQEASEEVKTILEEDPELTEPGHHILQKKMMQFQEEQLSKMNL